MSAAVPRRLLPLLLVLAAACADRPRDDGRGEIPDVPVRAVDEAGRTLLSPAESAAAVRAVDEHSRRMHDSVRSAAGIEHDDPPARAPLEARPVPRTRAECMAEAARALSPEEREMLEGICERLPLAP